MNQFINKYRGTKIKHIDWYGQNVCSYHGPIVNYLKSIGLAKEASTFATVQLLESANETEVYIIWSSLLFSSNAVCILDLDEENKITALKLLRDTIDNLEQQANELLVDEKFDKVKFGQLLKKAIQYPDHSFVYYENGNILLTGWGFSMIDQESKKVISLSTIIPNNKPNVKDETLNENELVDSHYREPISHEIEQESNSNQENLKTTESDEDDIQSEKIVNTHSHLSNSDQSTNNRVNDEKTNDWWIWIKRFLLLLLLLIIAFIIYYIFTHSEPVITKPDSSIGQTGSLDQPFDKIKDFNPINIQPGPGRDSIFNIVNDRLNVAIVGQNSSLSSLESILKSNFDTTQFQIIYKNALTNRIQLESNLNYLNVIKTEIKSKNPSLKILAWFERIFENNKTFNDPMFNNVDTSWYLNEIQANEAWDITIGNSNVVVAVLDSGFDLEHDEIKNKIYKPFDVTSVNALKTYSNDIGKHGTHVASLSVGEANNKKGLAGIAPKCKLMPIKVGNDNGQIAASYIIDGVLYAIKNGAHVINISIGAQLDNLSSLPVQVQEEIARTSAIDEGEFWNELFLLADSKNVIIVLAAGNSNVLAKIDPMKRAQRTIIVGASDESNKLAEFSNYGSNVTITAPGTNIYSASNGNKFESLDGTSMASPIVAGACALLKSKNPNIKSKEIINILIKTGKVSKSTNHQAGPIIQIFNALKQIN